MEDTKCFKKKSHFFKFKACGINWVLFSSSQKQSLALTSDISVLEMSRKELEHQMGSLREKHQRDAASLKSQLSEAESQAKDVQKEVTQSIISLLRKHNTQ